MTVFVGETGSFSGYTATSLAQYIKRIGYIKSDDNLYFRGLSKFAYDLSPSIDRIMIEKQKWLSKESRLVEFAEQSNSDIFAKRYPTLVLSNMQHYGIPTRMLDITGNSLVALYFACENDKEDGKVVVFDGKPISAYNPFANVIADTYRLINNSIIDVETYFYLIEKQWYASTLFYPEWKNNPQNVENYLNILCKPMIIDVGIINLRQRNQDGKFILFPNKIDNNKILNELVTVDYPGEFVKAIIRIPKEEKAKIREQLKLVGINDSFIFPDDINKVLEELKFQLKNER